MLAIPIMISSKSNRTCLSSTAPSTCMPWIEAKHRVTTLAGGLNQMYFHSTEGCHLLRGKDWSCRISRGDFGSMVMKMRRQCVTHFRQARHTVELSTSHRERELQITKNNPETSNERQSLLTNALEDTALR
ncbi:hypothetical protein SK128_023657 [Halocaridina rubra]|uniref:Uncharacterized protein n=1 Tax=Halocaridina rubra TaxID=373956 RepID=A0AAN9AG28_HALRR